MTADPPPSDLIDRLRADWRSTRPDLDTSGLELEGRLMRLGRLLEQKTLEALKPFDLHYTDFDILATLRRIGPPHSMTPTRLLESVVLTSGAMTAALKRVERAGLVERQPSAEDGRVKQVTLTRAGVKLTDRAATARFASALDTADKLKKRDQKDLAHLLRQLLLAIEGA